FVSALRCLFAHCLTCSLFPSTALLPTSRHTLSLHDALPISRAPERAARTAPRAYQARNTTLTAIAATSGAPTETARMQEMSVRTDRKSTRLNSSHVSISYAVFCLKKKKIKNADDSRSAGDHR